MYAIRSYYEPFLLLPLEPVGLDQPDAGDVLLDGGVHRGEGLLRLPVMAVERLAVLPGREHDRITSYNVCYTKLLRNAAVQENVTGIRLVKAYGLEGQEEKRFHRTCREYYRQNVSVSKTSAAFHGAIGVSYNFV